MIKEALEYVSNLTQSGLKPEKVETGDQTRLTFFVSGEPVTIDRPISPRHHEADDLATLCTLATRFAEQQPVIWVDNSQVVLVMDDDGHRVNTATVRLELTTVFSRLKELDKSKPWLDQRAFIRLLRIELNGTLAPGILLDRVRKLRFEAGTIVTTEAKRDRESMGKQITAAVSADGELPEGVTLLVRVFRGGEQFPINCSVDVDPSRGLLQLIPFPDEIERVTDLAVGRIQELIGEDIPDTVIVYNGRP